MDLKWKINKCLIVEMLFLMLAFFQYPERQCKKTHVFASPKVMVGTVLIAHMSDADPSSMDPNSYGGGYLPTPS